MAALAATGVVSAQSSVTIYGRAHVAFDAAYSANGGTASGLSSNAITTGSAFNVANRQRVADDGSRIGFRVTEDLGGGLRAFALIETGVNLDSASANGQSGAANTGTGFLGTREAHVGIGNSTGELRLGRQNVFWANGPIEDVSANRISGGVISSYTAPSSGWTSAPASRMENTIQLIGGSALGAFAGSSIWYAKPNLGESGAPVPTSTASTAVTCSTATPPVCSSTTTTTNNLGNTTGDQKAAAHGITVRFVQGPFAVQFDYGQNKNTNNGLSITGGASTFAPTLDTTITGQKLGLAYTYAPGCWRRSNIDHLCRLNIDQGT